MEALARRFLDHLVGAVQRQLRYADALAVPFRGDLGDLLLARLLADQADVTTFLVAPRPVSENPATVRRMSKVLRLPLVEIVATPSKVAETRRRFEEVTGGLEPRSDDDVLWFLAAEEGRLVARRLVASDGWARLLAPTTEDAANHQRAQKVASHWGVQLRLPYRDPGLRRWMQSDASDALRAANASTKNLLEQAGEIRQLPRDLLESGAHRGAPDPHRPRWVRA